MNEAYIKSLVKLTGAGFGLHEIEDGHIKTVAVPPHWLSAAGYVELEKVAEAVNRIQNGDDIGGVMALRSMCFAAGHFRDCPICGRVARVLTGGHQVCPGPHPVSEAPAPEQAP